MPKQFWLLMTIPQSMILMHAFSKRWLSGKRLTGEAGLALAAITT
jgi:hypothetical protein